jgi:DNA processing protein
MTADSRSELTARLALLAAPGLTGPAVVGLIEKCGSGLASLGRVREECGADVNRALRSDRVRERVRRALEAIAGQGIRVLAFDEPGYPQLLRARLDMAVPPLLFARGSLELLDVPAVAVVGCRQASQYGLDMAERIGGAVARAGGCVVSGVAAGIDAAAHAAALDAGGATIGVLGCGVDVYYPRRNLALQDAIARHGLLLSELLPGEPPRKYQFPHRNRIIAALSRAVVIVEAGHRSGALSTALHAIEQDVPLYGVPNAVEHPNVQGILGLFEDGIPPYTGERQLLESCGLLELGAPPPPAAAGEEPPADALARRVWTALAREAAHVDRIAADAGLAATDALVALLELELDGRALQHPGGRFSRVPQRRNRRVVAG